MPPTHLFLLPVVLPAALCCLMYMHIYAYICTMLDCTLFTSAHTLGISYLCLPVKMVSLMHTNTVTSRLKEENENLRQYYLHWSRLLQTGTHAQTKCTRTHWCWLKACNSHSLPANIICFGQGPAASTRYVSSLMQCVFSLAFSHRRQLHGSSCILMEK